MLEAIQTATDVLKNPAIVTVLVVVGEAALRAWPSAKPWGLIHIGAAVTRKVAGLLQAVADLSDKVIPQNTQG